METADGVQGLGVGDAVLVDGRTAHRIVAVEGADVVVADLRLVDPVLRPPSPLVVRGFSEHHGGVAALVGICQLSDVCRTSLFAASYGNLIGAAMTSSWLDLEERDISPDPVVAEVVAAVSAQPGEAWTVERMARVAHLSRSALGERFRRAVGRSPVEVLREVRMREARRLLGESSHSVEHVAFAVGYGSAAAFSRAFSAHHGRAPQAWRDASASWDPQQGEEHPGRDGGGGPEQQRGGDAVRVEEHAS
ncbi:helix-turn-helix transcriptional regulator [Actinocorallia sp. A-T 12471]|uniref:helix-turn-helix transcriptional regulator n=1 Tax=Actinocorallia sp. A-T 12471 TaxID=3089813 RepID=UPI0029D21EF8|nr:helix-turn-helix transcriptional regulator [Actinocorallia sp. A-T 12471]MDX6744218.1 helix-turn-helix transcriptional regulator [Actinocorallia sp. A-T 12471]